MSTKTDIETLRAGEAPRICYLDIFVHKIVDENTFIVSDGVENILLDITGNQEQGKDLAVSKCFRVMKPKLIKDKLVFATNFKACPVATFQPAKLTSKEFKRFTPKPLELIDLVAISDIADVSANQTAPTLFLKVFFVSQNKKGPFSDFRMVKVKDAFKNKHFVQLYEPHKDVVEVGKVYKFSQLLIQNYRKEGEKWGRIRSQRQTKVSLAPLEVLSFFELITAGDRVIDGIIFAHEKVCMYQCCPNCTRAQFQTSGNVCKHCGNSYTTPSKDFRATLIVNDDSRDDLVNILVFRSQLGLEFDTLTEDTVQEKLESFHLSRVVVEYDSKENDPQPNMIQAESLVFPDLSQ